MADTPPKTFQVYKSSAGSGKTYTLVKEYLKIILRGPEKMPEVLAITFTNAAAAQMKSKIIEELGKISTIDPTTPENEIKNDLLNKILAEYREEKDNYCDAKMVIENAKKVLEKILHTYSDFSVSTIDSFVHRIIRSFAFDLHVPVNFEVESDAGQTLSKAIDLVIGETGKNPQLTEFLVTFVARQAEDDRNLGIERIFGNLAITLLKEDGHEYIEKLKNISLDDFLKIEKNISRKIQETENHLQNKAKEAIELIARSNISPDSFFQTSRGIYAYIERISNKDFSKLLPNLNVEKTISEDKWASSKASSSQIQVIEGIKPALKQLAEQLIQAVEQNLSNYNLLKAVSRNIFPLGVLNEIQKAVDGIKKENALLHFSDFNKKISRIVAEQPIPFIYERVGERYKHYMIDEFQDTSLLQWQNLLPLIDNGLSGGNKSLVVGDGKQAIYRWRGGEVKQFVNLPNIPDEIKAEAKPQWQNTLRRSYCPNNLATNWRSDEKIVEFNNRFFLFANQYLEQNLGEIYQDVEQIPSKKESGGFVQVRFLEKEGYRQNTIIQVIETVERLKESGHSLGEIAILCRSNKNGSLIARNLIMNGIQVISLDSLLLNQSEEVIFILAMLKLLVDKNNCVAACEAINFLIQEKKIIQHKNLHLALYHYGVFPVFSNKAQTNWQAVINKMLKNQGLLFNHENLKHLSVYDATEEIVRAFFAAKRPNPFVNFFMDYMFEYSSKGNQSITDFIQWWDDSSKDFSIVTPGGIDAVRVMSIHKAKGLQFPIVIYPFASINREKFTKNGFWMAPRGCEELEALPAAYLDYLQKPLEETPYYQDYLEEKALTMLDNLNLLYVALTRAEKKLYVFSLDGPTEGKNSPQAMLKLFLENNTDFDYCELKNQYSFGEPSPKVKKEGKEATEKKKEENDLMKKFFSKSWSDSLRVASRQEALSTSSSQRSERGQVFHAALEKIVTISDIRPVLEDMVAREQVDADTAKEWENNLVEILTGKEIAPCFSSKANIKIEPGLFDKNGNFLRPDRVVFLRDKTIVIDYKSGQEYTHHKNQVDNYASILQEMGHQNVEKYLLYIDEPRLVKW